MKKTFLVFVYLCVSIAISAAGLKGVRIYVDPGHGSWGDNDRPCATIPYPNMASTGRPDTCGFYESNTNLWKCEELRDKLEAAGAIVKMSRTKNGTAANTSVSVRAQEATEFQADYFISVHSNADSDGTLINYLYLISGHSESATSVLNACEERGKKAWPFVFDAMGKGFEIKSHYTYTTMKVHSQGGLGVLRHSIPGFLAEGYFHTYQPARHRALNPDYCREEGLRYYRGIAAWYGLEGAAADPNGYILGAVKDLNVRMNHSLYTYRPDTHDQYKPCNGAVVTLYKAGEKVADYKVDNNYNGLFFFRDLEPGSDYSLDITCAGYEPLADEYKTNITVTANTTTYPIVFLEGKQDHTFQKGVATTHEIEGTIKRTIPMGDSTIVLSHTTDKLAHLYLINHLTNAVTPISTTGITAATNNAKEYLALSDIALTSDGKLIGCNYIRCQFDGTYVASGDVRGVSQLYKWDSLTAKPTKWVTSQNSGNFGNAEVGYTMTVTGASDDCIVYLTAVTNATSLNMRFVAVAIKNNVASVSYTQSDPQTACSGKIFGTNYLLQVSPRNTKEYIIIDGEQSVPMELDVVTGSKTNTVVSSTAPDYGKFPSETNFIKYGERNVLVTPYTNADNKVAGVRLYDVTDGIDKATLITTNLDLATPVAATFTAASVTLHGQDMKVYLFTDKTVTTFTTADPIKGIYAYSLDLQKSGSDYTFSFMANDDAEAAELVFYKGDTEVGTMALSNVLAGENSLTIAAHELPGKVGDVLMWGIKLQGKTITLWGQLYHETSVLYTRAFNTVDNSPESDYFGRIYVMNRAGSASTSNGIYVYDQAWKLQNKTNYRGGLTLGDPQRLTVDAEGTLYIVDRAAAHSGIYVADPANISGTFTNFFEGATRATSGVLTLNGAEVASPISGGNIYGTGADTKLFAYSEKAGSTLKAGDVLMYNIGQADGTIAHTWTQAPSKVYHITGNLNTDGNIWALSRGFFISTNRGAGNNNEDATSLQFYDYEGTQQYTSGSAANKAIINGSPYAGFAVSRNEDVLILNNASQQFLVFGVTWTGNVPELTLQSIYEHGITDIRQMNFDYAGNLIVSGESGLYIFSVPSTENVTTTPAKKALTVTVAAKNDVVTAEEIEREITIYYSMQTIHNPQGVALQVFNVNGQLVAQGSRDIDMSAMAQGVYIVRSNVQGFKSLKIVKL